MLPTDLLPKAQQIIDRLAAIDYENPNIDEQRIRGAFSRHLIALNQRDRFVEIYRSFYAAFDTVWEDTYDAAWKVATEATERAVSKAAIEAAGQAADDAGNQIAINAAMEAARKAAFDVASDAASDAPHFGAVEVAWDAAFKRAQEAASDAAFRVVNKTASDPLWNTAWNIEFDSAFYSAWRDAKEAVKKVAKGAALRTGWDEVWKAAFGDTWECSTRSGASDLAYKFAGYAAWDTPRRFAENAARDIARESALEAAFDGDWNAVRGTGTEAWWAVAKAVEIVNSTTNSPEYDRFCAVWMPFVDAIEAGLFCFWVTPTKVIVLTTPVMRIEPVTRIQDYRLHADGQPAVQWSDWECYYFWHGTQIPQKYGAVLSKNWRSQWLLEETNAELRRVLIQGIGYDRILQELEAVELDTWREYTLLNTEVWVDGEPIYLLEMTCPSTNQIYVLRVPPHLTSAREAIRWANWDVDPEAFAVET